MCVINESRGVPAACTPSVTNPNPSASILLPSGLAKSHITERGNWMIAAQVELVGDGSSVLERLGLRLEMLVPIPLASTALRERV